MKRELQPAVYIMTSGRNGTLYIGVTSNIIQRVWQHKQGAVEGFTAKYGVKTLVWYEQHATMEHAIAREKALKKWNRVWKLELIESANPEWRDLWQDIVEDSPGAHSGANDPTARHSGAGDATARHSRERGNPEECEANTTRALDSRIRGNDAGSRK